MPVLASFNWTTNNNWICPPGVYKAQAEVIAGGGGGSSASGVSGAYGGGGGGAYSSTNFTPTIGQTYAIVVGGGGAASATASPNNGGNSTFGGTVAVAEGGRGRTGNNTGANVAGGAAANGTGDTKYSGGTGSQNGANLGGGGGGPGGYNGAGLFGNVTTGGGNGTVADPGLPGNAGLGGNGATNGSAVGGAGTAPGSGGGGATRNSTTDRVGGTGTAGKVWLTYITPSTSALRDDFNDNTQNTNLWKTLGGGTTSETNTQLSTTVAQSTAGNEAGFASVEMYDMTGSYVYVEVVQVASDTTNVYTQLEVAAAGDNSLGLGLHGSSNLQAWYNVNGVYAYSGAAAYNSTTMRWWRIRESGGNIYWDYSADGVTWTNYYSHATPITITGLTVRLHTYEGASAGGTAASRTAIYDNFNLGRRDGWGRFNLMNWYNAGYQYVKTIRIAQQMVSGTADLSNYPCLIKFTDTALKVTGSGGQVTNSSGYDIIFTDVTGVTLLNWEIQNYISTTGELEFWVQVPTLYATQDTYIQMFFRNSAISTFQSTATAAWDANYAVVYHLNTNTNDSTATPLNGTNSNATQTTGPIYGAYAFNGSPNTYINCGNAAKINITSPGITIEAWINNQDATWSTSNRRIIQKDTADDQYRVIAYALTASALSPATYVRSSVWTAGPVERNAQGQCPAVQSWHYIAMSYNTSTGSAIQCVDGADGTKAQVAANILTATGNMWLGGKPGSAVGGDFWNGYLAEVRISNIARSADYMITVYRNTSAPGTYLSESVIGTRRIQKDSVGRFNLYAATPYTQVILGDSPQRYWRLIESDGTAHTWTNTSSGKPGTYSGGVTYSDSGPIKEWETLVYAADYANTLDGSSGKCVFESGYNSSGYNAITVEAWFMVSNTTYSGNPRIVNDSHTDVDHLGFQLLVFSNTSHQFHVGNGTTSAFAYFDKAAAANVWHHIAGTWTAGGKVSIYLDGVLGTQSAGTLSGTIGTTASPVTVGVASAYAGDWMPGRVSEVAIYNTALSQATIQKHYQQGRNPEYMGRMRLSLAKAGMGRLRASLAKAGMGRFRSSLAKAGMGRTRASLARAGMGRQRLSKALAGMGRMLLQPGVIRDAVGRLRLSRPLDALARLRLSIFRAGMGRLRTSKASAGMGRTRLSKPLNAVGRFLNRVPVTLAGMGRARLSQATAAVGRMRLSRALAGMGRARLSQAKAGMGRFREQVTHTLDSVGRLRLSRPQNAVGRARVSLARAFMGRLRMALALPGQGRYRMQVTQTRDMVGRYRSSLARALVARWNMYAPRTLVGRFRLTMLKDIVGRFLLSKAISAVGRVWIKGVWDAAGRFVLVGGTPFTRTAFGRVKFNVQTVLKDLVGRVRFSQAIASTGRVVYSAPLMRDMVARLRLSQAVNGMGRTRITQAKDMMGRMRIGVALTRDSVARLRLTVARDAVGRLLLSIARAGSGRLRLRVGVIKDSVARLRMSEALALRGRLRLSAVQVGMARLRLSLSRAVQGRLSIGAPRTLDLVGRLRLSYSRYVRGRVAVSVARSVAARFSITRSLAALGRTRFRAIQTLDTVARMRLSHARNSVGRFLTSQTRTASGLFLIGGGTIHTTMGRVRYLAEQTITAIGRSRLSLALAATGRLALSRPQTTVARMRLSRAWLSVGRLLLSRPRDARSRMRVSLARAGMGFFMISWVVDTMGRLRVSVSRDLVGRFAIGIETILDPKGRLRLSAPSLFPTLVGRFTLRPRVLLAAVGRVVISAAGQPYSIDMVARWRLSLARSGRGRFVLRAADVKYIVFTGSPGQVALVTSTGEVALTTHSGDVGMEGTVN